MIQTIKIFQIILAVLLTIVILMQQKGSGLGMVFGGESNFYRSRRGIENVLHWATVAIAVLFSITAIATIFVS